MFHPKSILGSPSAASACGAVAYSPLTQCTEFDGVDERIQGSAGESAYEFQATDDYTLLCWLKRNGYPSSSETVLSYYNFAPAIGWSVDIGAGEVFAMLRQSNLDRIEGKIFPPASAFLDDQWHLFGLTYDGSNAGTGFKFFIDGAVDSTGFTTNDVGTITSIGYGSERLNVGNRGIGASTYYDGRACHPAVIKRLLTEAEMACLASLGQPVDLASLPWLLATDIAGWFKLGDGDTIGVGNVINLGSGGAGDATGQNMEAADFQIPDVPP